MIVLFLVCLVGLSLVYLVGRNIICGWWLVFLKNSFKLFFFISYVVVFLKGW